MGVNPAADAGIFPHEAKSPHEHGRVDVVEPHGLTGVVPLLTSAQPAEACPPSPSHRRATALWRRRGFGGYPLAFLHGLTAVASCVGG
jgi:hypothetical protein